MILSNCLDVLFRQCVLCTCVYTYICGGDVDTTCVITCACVWGDIETPCAIVCTCVGAYGELTTEGVICNLDQLMTVVGHNVMACNVVQSVVLL